MNILDGENYNACRCASSSQWSVNKKFELMQSSKAAENVTSRLHTLVSHFRKCIPCGCLKKKPAKSNTSQRWSCAWIQNAACLTMRSNAVKCSTALGAVRHRTVPENAKWLTGRRTKNYVTVPDRMVERNGIRHATLYSMSSGILLFSRMPSGRPGCVA